MNCTQARSAMLECELADLAVPETGRLARHIGGCGDCRARAEAIVAGTGTLRTLLASRARPGARLTARRSRAMGALTVAAGLLIVVALARRVPRAPIAPEARAALQRSPVTIDNAQGRAVTVVERRDTIAVVFHIPESNE